LGITIDKRKKIQLFSSMFSSVCSVCLDKASFHNNGQLNRHNCHYWSTHKPHWTQRVDNQHCWSNHLMRNCKWIFDWFILFW